MAQEKIKYGLPGACDLDERGSLVMAAALAVGMTACSSQNNSQTTAAGTAAESQSSGAAGAENGDSESAAESNAEASDAKAGDADQGYYKEAGLDVEIIELIKKYPNTYLVHLYSADHDLDGYLDLDCYFSVGPDVIWNPAVQQVAKRVPENRILLETDGMEAVKWAWEEGQKNQNYAIEERESIWEAAEDQTKEISVSDSLYATACMVSKLRNILTETLINLTSDNFFAFWWNSYGNRLTNK